MNTKKKSSFLRSLGCGLLMAVFGFSYAVATTGYLQPSSRASVESRELSRTELSFVSPDSLGQVLAGSIFIRQIVVIGGIQPHLFEFGANPPSDELVIISEEGLVSGAPESPGVLTFDVQVTDKIGGQVTAPVSKTFSIGVVNHSTGGTVGLEFLDGDTLPDGALGSPYFHSFAVIGGVPPYTYELDSDDDFAALPAGLNFVRGGEEIGLDPGGGGVIFGKPAEVTAAPATFNVRVTDSQGRREVKEFKLTIVQGQVSTSLVGMKGSFKLDFGREQKDSLNLAILLDKGDLDKNTSVEGKTLTFIFGGITLPPLFGPEGEVAEDLTFNARGEMKFPNLTAGLLPSSKDESEVKVKFDPKRGMLRASFKKISLASAIGATRGSFRDPVIPVTIIIPDVIERTDAVKFIYQRKGTKGIGKTSSNGELAPAGLFLAKKVRGNIKLTTQQTETVALKIQGFLRQPGGNPVVPSSGDTIGVFLGVDAKHEIPATSFIAKGNKLSFKSDSATDLIKKFEIDTARGTFKIDTNPLSAKSLGFEQEFLTAGDLFQLSIGLLMVNETFDETTFDGQTSVTMRRKGNRVTN